MFWRDFDYHRYMIPGFYVAVVLGGAARMANTPAIRSKQAARATPKGSRSLLCAMNSVAFMPSRSFWPDFLRDGFGYPSYGDSSSVFALREETITQAFACFSAWRFLGMPDAERNWDKYHKPHDYPRFWMPSQQVFTCKDHPMYSLCLKWPKVG